MKNIVLLLGLILFWHWAAAQNPPSSERLKIILTVRNIFEGTDEQNWSKVQGAFAPKVFLDYSSLSGNPGTTTTSDEIIESWKKVIPGFDSTHHQLARFQVVIKDNKAKVHYFGKADHFIGTDKWIVEGVYDTVLEKEHDQWIVTRHKFTLDQQRGGFNVTRQGNKNRSG